MRFSILAALSASFRLALAVKFMNPPPPSPGTDGNFAANPVYPEGSAIEAAWTDTEDNGIPFSVVVYQVDTSSREIPASQAFEYVVRKPSRSLPFRLLLVPEESESDQASPSADNAVNLTSTHWVVATAKNLTYSNVFVLSIFFQGDTTGRALSHFFNISSKAIDGAAQRATQTVTVSVTATATSSSTAEGAASAPLADSNEGFGTAAKVGVAVGVAAALALGIVMGWFLARRMRGGIGQPAVGGSGVGHQGYGAAAVGVSFGAEAVLQQKAPPGELNGEAPRHELYGTHP
jgi:hypothetical protein